MKGNEMKLVDLPERNEGHFLVFPNPKYVHFHFQSKRTDFRELDSQQRDEFVVSSHQTKYSNPDSLTSMIQSNNPAQTLI